MTEAFNLRDYSCPLDTLPSVLWRVTHSNSQHEIDPETGDLRAKDIWSSILNKETLKLKVKNHFKWSRESGPSCFLSTFSDGIHACRWAAQRRERSGQEVSITRINTALLPSDAYVFEAARLKRELKIAYKYDRDEYVFFRRIPSESSDTTEERFVQSMDIPSTEEDRVARREEIVVCLTRLVEALDEAIDRLSRLREKKDEKGELGELVEETGLVKAMNGLELKR